MEMNFVFDADDKVCYNEDVKIKQEPCFDNDDLNIDGTLISEDGALLKSETVALVELKFEGETVIESQESHGQETLFGIQHLYDDASLLTSSRKSEQNEDLISDIQKTGLFDSIPDIQGVSIKSEEGDFIGDLDVIKNDELTTETYKCIPCGQCFDSKDNLRVHKRIHKDKPYHCQICNKFFGHLGNYRSHLEKHSRVYICDTCGKSFENKSSFNKHQLVHTETKPHECGECGKRFSQPSSLKVHHLIHTGERPFQCRHCDMTFRTPHTRKRHERLHSGERPFQCEVCNKTFVQRYNYQVHLRTHSGEKPYFCDVCGASYKEPIGLIEHKRKHTGERPFSCEVCNKSFDRRGYLIIHRKIHEGNRAYKCEFCDKTFIRTCDVRRHQKIHLKERPYSCDLCGKFFSRSDYVKTHRVKCLENVDLDKNNGELLEGETKDVLETIQLNPLVS